MTTPGATGSKPGRPPRWRAGALLLLTAAGAALLGLVLAGLLFGLGPIPALELAVVEAPGP